MHVSNDIISDYISTALPYVCVYRPLGHSFGGGKNCACFAYLSSDLRSFKDIFAVLYIHIDIATGKDVYYPRHTSICYKYET